LKRVVAQVTEILDARGCEFLKDVGLNVVVEALDNVTARMYMNMGVGSFKSYC